MQKQTGFCKNKPMLPPELGGNGRCKFHGGASTGAKTAEGKARQIAASQKANTKHGYYGRMLSKLWSPEKLEAYRKANRGTDCSDEIGLCRAHIADIEGRMAKGEVTIQGTRNEIFLEDVLVRKNALLNTLLRSQHEMHPEANNTGKLRIELSIASGEAAKDEDVPDIEGNTAQPVEQTPVEQEEAIAEAQVAHSLEELFEDP